MISMFNGICKQYSQDKSHGYMCGYMLYGNEFFPRLSMVLESLTTKNKVSGN